MPDDQHTSDDTPIEDRETPESPGVRRGLGRFTSRFRRDATPSEDARPQLLGDTPPLTPAWREQVEQSDDPLEDGVEPSFLRPGALTPLPDEPDESDPEESEPVEPPSIDLDAPPTLDPRLVAPPPTPPVPEEEPLVPMATVEEVMPAPAEDEEPAALEPPARPDDPDEAKAVIDAAPTAEPEAPEPIAAPLLTIAEEPPTLSPLVDATATEEDARLLGPRFRSVGISAHLAVVSGIATMVILAYLLIEPSPRWLLLLGAAAVVFGLDGTLRQTWRAPFSFGQETAPFLFVPALYMLAVPVLIEHNVSGELVLLVGLGAGLGFGALAWAEVASVRTMAPEYDQARLLVTANTYLTGFAIFSLSYVFEISLPAAIIATAIAAAMLAVEVLREGEIDPMETLGLALVTGIVIGEARWLLYYMPLDTYLAGLTLLLAFYLVTGLLHSHVIRALTRAVAFEYSGIAAAGLALVVVARAAGLA